MKTITKTRFRTVTPSRGRKSHVRRVAGGIAALVAIAAGATNLISTPGSRSDDCVLALDGDGTISGNDETLVEERIRAAQEVLTRYADRCSSVVVGNIKALPGQGTIWSGPLGSSSDNTLDAKTEREQRVGEAHRQIADIFRAEPTPGTGIVRSLRDLEDLPGSERKVIAYMFTDGLETEAINVYDKTLSEPELMRAVRGIAPVGMPDWEIYFVGVNRTAKGGVEETVAETAERFWRALLGPALRGYSPALSH